MAQDPERLVMAEDPLKEMMDKINKQRDTFKHNGAELMSLDI